MAFGQQSGPPATARQVQQLTEAKNKQIIRMEQQGFRRQRIAELDQRVKTLKTDVTGYLMLFGEKMLRAFANKMRRRTRHCYERWHLIFSKPIVRSKIRSEANVSRPHLMKVS